MKFFFENQRPNEIAIESWIKAAAKMIWLAMIAVMVSMGYLTSRSKISRVNRGASAQKLGLISLGNSFFRPVCVSFQLAVDPEII